MIVRQQVPPIDAVHCLIVDDVEENRDLLARRFQKRGFPVLQAADGQSALDLLRQAKVDLVILDIMMPGITGLDVLLRIREAFDVELSIDDVYSGTLTLADLAARIEAAQMGGLDAAEYAALLAEIENMSDEQARELLEREQTGQA